MLVRIDIIILDYATCPKRTHPHPLTHTHPNSLTLTSSDYHSNLINTPTYLLTSPPPPGALTQKEGMGMCGPEDPLFMPLSYIPIQEKELKASVHKTHLSEAKISSQAPHFGYLGRMPRPEKKLSAPPGLPTTNISPHPAPHTQNGYLENLLVFQNT